MASTNVTTVPTERIHTSPFSNPLYFKTALVAFLAQWPIVFMCYVVFIYNLVNYKNMRATVKMIFFPVLLFPTILDNSYDIITGASVDKYDSTHLRALIGVFSVMAAASLIYLASYMYEALRNPNSKGMYRRLATSDEMETDEDQPQTAPMSRWRRIIDEYMTANIIWSITVYNMMLLAIYVARYITHTDKNFMREVDVALLSAVLGGVVIIVVIFDFALFRNPASGSVFMHYVIAAVFSLNFTIDFHAQVGFCEILTLGVFFVSVFLAVFKLKMFVELGTPATKKIN